MHKQQGNIGCSDMVGRRDGRGENERRGEGTPALDWES